MWRAVPAAPFVWIASRSTAVACTICHSPTALEVRRHVFEHDFLGNAAAVAAPIPILFAVILLMAREPPKRSEPDLHGP